MPLNRAEATAASSVAFLASAIITAYLADWFGFAIAPFFVLAVSVAAAAIVLVRLSRAVRRRPRRGDRVHRDLCAGFAWLSGWRGPDFLPTGSGPDLAHHLALVDYIERHRQFGARSRAERLPRRDDRPTRRASTCWRARRRVAPDRRPARRSRDRRVDGGAESGPRVSDRPATGSGGRAARPFAAIAVAAVAAAVLVLGRVVHRAIVPGTGRQPSCSRSRCGGRRRCGTSGRSAGRCRSVRGVGRRRVPDMAGLDRPAADDARGDRGDARRDGK